MHFNRFSKFSKPWDLGQFIQMNKKFSKFEQAMTTATASMNFAPMLAILFIGARMRALQMDPVNGNPACRNQSGN